MTDLNVVSLLDRIAGNKRDDRPALVSSYEPNVDDMQTFLRVLRHIQRRSHDEVAKLNLTGDLLEIQISEVIACDSGETSAFTDCTTATRRLSFDIPWQLFDVDESEVLRDRDGVDVITKFSEVALQWINTIEVNRS